MLARDSRRRICARAGFALLEVLVSLVILTTAAATVVALAGESSRAVRRAGETARSLSEAARFFGVVAIWPRDDLDRHLGEHPQGRWRLRVERLTPSLYALALRDSAGAQPLFATVVCRPNVDAESTP